MTSKINPEMISDHYKITNTFPDKAAFEAADLADDVTVVNLTGMNTVTDGEGGVFISQNNGSLDIIVSGGRAFYRVKDVSLKRISASVNAHLAPSPLDYGAIGDGVTDDFQAIKTCIDENSNRLIDGRGLTYYSSVRPLGLKMVNGLVKIDGEYLSGGASVSFKQSMSFAPYTDGGGLSLSGAKENYSSAWASSLVTDVNAHAGGLAFDPHTNRWLAQYENSDGNSGFIARYNRWFGDLTEETRYPDDQRIGHQGFAIDRLGDGSLHAWTSHRYHVSDRPNAGRQVIRFKLNSTLDDVRVYTLFGDDFAYTQGSCMPAVSPCNRYLVATARKNSRDFWVRVFDLRMLIEHGAGDYSDRYLTQWGVDPSMLADGADGTISPCQNIATDGKSVFFICGNAAKQQKCMAQYDINGRLIEISDKITVGLNSQTGNFYEPQAIAIFNDTNGVEKMAMLIISNPRGTKENMVWYLNTQTLGNFLEPANSSTMRFKIRGSDGVMRTSNLTFTP